jgi:hypothetical protein
VTHSTLANAGTITGGGGGAGGNSGPGIYGGVGGAGGAGVVLSVGLITNTGVIIGGAAGASSTIHLPPPPGVAGFGLVGSFGQIVNGSASSHGALISGVTGVADGAGGLTVTNFGTIVGTGGTAVRFSDPSNRLIVEAGSTWAGSVSGGGGTLELAASKTAGTITGLGASGALSGPEAMTFSGFGTYLIDVGSTWTLGGAASLAAGRSLSAAAS